MIPYLVVNTDPELADTQTLDNTTRNIENNSIVEQAPGGSFIPSMFNVVRWIVTGPLVGVFYLVAAINLVVDVDMDWHRVDAFTKHVLLPFSVLFTIVHTCMTIRRINGALIGANRVVMVLCSVGQLFWLSKMYTFAVTLLPDHYRTYSYNATVRTIVLVGVASLLVVLSFLIRTICALASVCSWTRFKTKYFRIDLLAKKPF
jgi:hypothetical protein